MVGSYCRTYRLQNKITLKSMASDMRHLKALSAFEHGRSSNLKHIAAYTKLARQLNDVDNFVNGLLKEL